MKIQTFLEEEFEFMWFTSSTHFLLSALQRFKSISETLKVKNLSKKSCYKVKTLREVYGTEYKNMIDVDTLPTDQHVRHEYEEYVSSQR